VDFADKNCTGFNQCYNYSCDGSFGCVALEKCGTTKCARKTCEFSSTGTCREIRKVVPPELDSPCFDLLSCNEITGTWTVTNKCDDSNANTIDICTLTSPTTFQCTYVCDDGRKCTCENLVNGVCVFSTNPSCNPSGPLLSVDALLAKVSECDDRNSCTDGEYDNGTCTYKPTECKDSDPCTIDTCEPSVGCLHLPMQCNETDNPSPDKCFISKCKPFDTGDGLLVPKCEWEPVECSMSVRIGIIVGVILSAGAVTGIIVGILVGLGITGTTAYYVKLNLAPEESPDTHWNEAFDKNAEGNKARKGGANPVHRRH